MKGKIDHLGMWTWGGRVYNWKRYLNNMFRSGMDTVVLWHTDKPPLAAAEIQEYARALGIKVVWGFNWSWNSPICLNSDEDSAHWKEIVTTLVRDYYAPLRPDGIVFQVGGTEFGASCRLDCDACKEGAETGVGELFLKFGGPIMNAVQEEWPWLKMHANLHLGGIHKSYKTLKTLDPAINLMWEDLPGPGYKLEVPFAYDWDPEEANIQDTTLDMIKQMCELRGDQEDVAFIIKGFPAYWGGNDPMLLEDIELKGLASIHKSKWDASAKYCERKLDQAMKAFRVIAESPAKSTTVLLLVELGLWEYRRGYAAELITEAARNPFRDPIEVIRAVWDIQSGNIE